MRKLSALLCALLLASPALGQAEAGDLGIYFDPAGSTVCTTASGFVVFNLYVAATGLGSFTGWEASLNFSNPSWNVLSRALNPPSSLNVCGGDCFIVGLGACVNSGPLYTLVNYQIGYFAGPVAPDDTMICIGGTTPSSFDGLPGYSTCADELRPMRLATSGGPDYPDGCSVINPLGMCPVGTQDSAWGALKARFGDS